MTDNLQAVETAIDSPSSTSEFLCCFIVFSPLVIALNVMIPLSFVVTIVTAIYDPTGVNIMIAVILGLIWIPVLVVTIVGYSSLTGVDKIERETRERDGDLEMGGDWNQSAEKTAEEEGVGREDGRAETLEWLHFVQQRD